MFVPPSQNTSPGRHETSQSVSDRGIFLEVNVFISKSVLLKKKKQKLKLSLSIEAAGLTVSVFCTLSICITLLSETKKVPSGQKELIIVFIFISLFRLLCRCGMWTSMLQ